MFTGGRFYIPSTFSSGWWKCLLWFEFSHGTPSAAARWLFRHTLESTRQFLEERYLLSDAPYSIRYGCACSLRINPKLHTLLHAEPNLCLRHLKAEKVLPSPGKCFSPPPEMPEPEKVILRPTGWNSGFMGSGLLWSPVPGPFLCLQRGLAIAGVFSSCRSAPSFLFDVRTFQPWVLFIGHDAVRIYKRELQEKSWNGQAVL